MPVSLSATRCPLLCLSALLALAGLYASCYRLVEVLGG